MCEVTVKIPQLEKSKILPENLNIDILYEDENLLVVNKPAGMVVHPGAGNTKSTLVNALLHHCKNTLSGIGGILRPGIVHRIDKMTSGLLVVAKDDITHKNLSEQFKNKTIIKEYFLFCWGNLTKKKGEIKNYLIRSKRNRKKMTISKINKGRLSSTNYEIIEEIETCKNFHLSFIKCILNTGRTHQIRVHMTHLGCALLGDNLYGRQKIDKVDDTNLRELIKNNFISLNRHALHSKKLGFYHPLKKKTMIFESPFPPDFQELIDYIKLQKVNKN